MNDKQQQIQDLINLNKDSELTIFKAIKAVDSKVDNLLSKENEPIELPEPVDMTPMCDKMDMMMAKMNEPMIVKVKII